MLLPKKVVNEILRLRSENTRLKRQINSGSTTSSVSKQTAMELAARKDLILQLTKEKRELLDQVMLLTVKSKSDKSARTLQKLQEDPFLAKRISSLLYEAS